MKRQGDRETRRQGDQGRWRSALLVSLSPCLLVCSYIGLLASPCNAQTPGPDGVLLHKRKPFPHPLLDRTGRTSDSPGAAAYLGGSRPFLEAGGHSPTGGSVIHLPGQGRRPLLVQRANRGSGRPRLSTFTRTGPAEGEGVCRYPAAQRDPAPCPSRTVRQPSNGRYATTTLSTRTV